ncbi:MAG: HEPN domain-containing protein [Chitinophagaceae bacterium]|nr:HEPN domain-containing protein [Chitinophagaceae bacterium]
MEHNQNSNLALGFIRGAYNDYIAGRVLLNAGYIMQGAILASTAVEKSFKAVLAIKGISPKWVHMDKIEKLKEGIHEAGYSVLFEKLDPNFLSVLSDVYKIRYFDNIKEHFSVGFFINQFIGELDHSFAIFERAYIMEKSDGSEALTPLKMDLKKGNQDLLENNWVAKKLNRKEFMENGCIAAGIAVNPINYFDHLELSSKPLKDNYMGKITIIRMVPEKK